MRNFCNRNKRTFSQPFRKGPWYKDKGLYKCMKKVLYNLHRRFRAVRIMTGLSTVNVFDIKTVPRGWRRLKIEGDCYLDTPTLFNGGSDGGAVTEELNNGVSLYTLKPRKISVHIVNGTCESNYMRRKIKIMTYKGVIRNYDWIVVNKIGREEAETKDYVQLIVDLFQMKQ